MVHVMSNATIEFKGDDNENFMCKVGFNSLPDWVEKTDHFKLCKGGLTPMINVIDGSSDKSIDLSSAVMAENEELKLKLKALEEKKELQQEIKQDEIDEVIEDVEKAKSRKQK